MNLSTIQVGATNETIKPHRRLKFPYKNKLLELTLSAKNICTSGNQKYHHHRPIWFDIEFSVLLDRKKHARLCGQGKT